MSPKTRRSPASSGSSETAFILELERSRLLAAWWLAIHLLAVAALLWSGLAAAVKIAGIPAALVHAVLRRPAAPSLLLRYADGSWAMPERGLLGLSLAEGTCVGPYWACLRFAGETGAVSVLLLRDQLDEGRWRALQAELRRTAPVRSARAPGE